MKINDLLEENKVELFIFHGDMWSRKGFYFPDIRTIYVNAELTQEEREKVILHELGHINHNPANYKLFVQKYENEADRFMIRHLIEEELSQYDVIDFNWYRFAKRHKISTTWGEQIIQEEFRKIVGR